VDHADFGHWIIVVAVRLFRPAQNPTMGNEGVKHSLLPVSRFADSFFFHADLLSIHGRSIRTFRPRSIHSTQAREVNHDP
jgi:hypothetical protein